jgi:hypothetical protein
MRDGPKEPLQYEGMPKYPQTPTKEQANQACERIMAKRRSLTQYEDPHPDLQTVTERRLLAIVKLAYRKHALGDDVIGWQELGERLQDEICNATTSNHYCEWVKGLGNAD